MVILTVIAMIIVIYVWLAYFNNLIANLSAPEHELAAEDPTSSFGFWQSTKNGLGLIYNGFIGKLRWLGDVLGEPREYIIPPAK